MLESRQDSHFLVFYLFYNVDLIDKLADRHEKPVALGSMHNEGISCKKSLPMIISNPYTK